MKKTLLVMAIAALAAVTWFCVFGQPALNPPKIKWMNDAVCYRTNSVWDDDRNKTNPQPSNFFYTKEVITTNKVDPWYFRFGDRAVELGAREDGVVVWRNRE